MTYNELYQEVCRLGFEGDVYPKDSFLFATRRALLQMAYDLPSEYRHTLRLRASDTPTVISLNEHLSNALYALGASSSTDRTLTVRVTENELYLSHVPAGDLEVRYVYRPNEPSGNDEQERIDMPKNRLHLLPLLVASYVFLEDDPERSQYYMTLYRDAMLRRSASHTSYTVPYVDVLGW